MNDRVARLNRLMHIKKLCIDHPYPALNDLDRKLEKYIGRKDGFFIECGANNGYFQSNTFYYEYQLGWKGILVEAIPELAAVCAYQRLNARVYNCGLVSTEYPDDRITLRFAGLKSLVSGCKGGGEAEDKWVSSGVHNEGLPGTYEVSVPARTLTSILDVERPEHIDLFSLDVEGYELEVLRGLDLERYRPEYILVEVHDPEGITAHLAPWYDLVEELTPGWDFLFKAKPRGVPPGA
ncbi:MAG: FkbM family methyltransferase [Pseudodesulfovibrio sp.]